MVGFFFLDLIEFFFMLHQDCLVVQCTEYFNVWDFRFQDDPIRWEVVEFSNN